MKLILEGIVMFFCVFFIMLWWNYAKEERKTRFYRNVGNRTATLKTANLTDLKKETYKENSSVEMFLHVPESDVQMLKLLRGIDQNSTDNLYKHVRIMNGAPETEVYDENIPDKFTILLVPHSHNEPGWMNTNGNYYTKKTHNILMSVVYFLSKDKRLRFIWSEVFFLSSFWDNIDNKTKIKLLKLVRNGQLEIVTGGWVMNDEANTHYFGILSQLIEGHQWLMNHLNYRPNNSWAIDVVGHSPTMPYLLKKMSLKNLVINRLHLHVKRYFVENKYTEFLWRQMWDTLNVTDLLTVVLPFHYNTCIYGCEHSFRYPEHNDSDSTLRVINELRGYVRSYRSNVLLVPVGGDSAYATAATAKKTFDKYTYFIDRVNSLFSGKIEARFSNLNEFFGVQRSSTLGSHFPVVLGDFFTYADTHVDHWSGIYSSRPLYKRRDRIVLNYLRATEILYALAWSSKRNPSGSSWLRSDDAGFYYLLLETRRNVGIFQHHQAITGTSKHESMIDYGRMLNKAMKDLQLVMQHSIRFLLYNHEVHPYESKNTELYLHLDERYATPDRIAEGLVLMFDKNSDKKRVVIFNSLTWKTRQLVCVFVNFYQVKVTFSNGTNVISQTSPLFSKSESPMSSVYQVCFSVKIEALSIDTYYISLVKRYGNLKSNFLSNITILRSNRYKNISNGSWRIKIIDQLKNISLSNHVLRAKFDKYGLLESLSFKNENLLIALSINFIMYKESSMAGAYVSDVSDGNPPTTADVVRVTDGPLYSQVDINLDVLRHSVRIHKTHGSVSFGLEIRNVVDMSEHEGAVAMRITSSIRNGDVFYTDLNGLHMVRRERFKSFGTGNYYPMSSSAYIEDGVHRLTLVSGQPGGFTSTASGEMEVMLDRKVRHDDERGLDEGLTDNVPFSNVFVLIFEKKIPRCKYVHKDHPSGVLSPYSTQLSYTILYPLIKLYSKIEEGDKLLSNFSGMSTKLGRDIHLVKMLSLLENGEPKAGILLHRFAINKCFRIRSRLFVSYQETINISSMFPLNFENEISRTSLSFTYHEANISKDKPEYISPMDMKAYLLT